MLRTWCLSTYRSGLLMKHYYVRDSLPCSTTSTKLVISNMGICLTSLVLLHVWILALRLVGMPPCIVASSIFVSFLFLFTSFYTFDFGFWLCVYGNMHIFCGHCVRNCLLHHVLFFFFEFVKKIEKLFTANCLKAKNLRKHCMNKTVAKRANWVHKHTPMKKCAMKQHSSIFYWTKNGTGYILQNCYQNELNNCKQI